MYKILYTKTAAKDVPKLKSAHLDEKAKALIEIIRVDPFRNPPPYEKLVGDLNGAYSRRKTPAMRGSFPPSPRRKGVRGSLLRSSAPIPVCCSAARRALSGCAAR